MTVTYCGPPGLSALCAAWGVTMFDRPVHLALGGRAYSDEHVEHICQLRSLKSLALERTRISEAGLMRISRALPDCEIVQ